MLKIVKHIEAFFFTVIYAFAAGLALKTAVYNADYSVKTTATAIVLVCVIGFSAMIYTNFTVFKSFEDDPPEEIDEEEVDNEQHDL